MTARVPEIEVSLKTQNRYALVSAIRQELRRAGRDGREIEHFSREALTADDHQAFREICARWVRVP